MDKEVSDLIRGAVSDVLDEVRKVPLPAPASQASGNRSEVNIDAGGIGVWIATTACIVMVVVSFFLSLWVLDLSRKVSELENYVHAIYMMAPSLKPEEVK